ncbi:arrestin domain-containing protein 3-like isoform X2 [Engraulis encrasicolus]|uniref:arrestin domain-containing protein 3-like isoform X2 n=1 Tax=Engraulis encrasicolus TaxID=184585 RepID=UPI002FD6C9E2
MLGETFKNFSVHFVTPNPTGVFHRGADELVLQPGLHVYPFCCPLPQGDFPSTFEGFYGKISYAVITGIHRAWHMEKTFTSEFKFERWVNIGIPELLLPLSASNRKNLVCFCCVSGEVSIDAHMDRKGYIPGETIKITAEFTNGTSRSFEPKAELNQTVTYYTNGRGHHKREYRTLYSTRGQTLGPHTSDARHDLTLTIPSDADMTLEDCDILTIEYKVQVSLKVGVCPALKVLFPIVIGNYRPPPLEVFQPPSYNAVF